jgi:CoA-transferase family III
MLMLADMGADVIKVEKIPDGDDTRRGAADDRWRGGRVHDDEPQQARHRARPQDRGRAPRLAASGADYHAAAVVENLDLSSIQIPPFPPGLPFVLDGIPATLIAVDRDAILARGDVAAAFADLDRAMPSDHAGVLATLRFEHSLAAR